MRLFVIIVLTSIWVLLFWGFLRVVPPSILTAAEAYRVGLATCGFFTYAWCICCVVREFVIFRQEMRRK